MTSTATLIPKIDQLNPRILLTTGALLAALAVIAGAFGAHALKSRLTPDQLQVFETGVRYHFFHSLILVILAFAAPRLSAPALQYSSLFFISGIVLFSGSLYLLSCRQLLGIDSWKIVLGPVTPLGGLCMITGWIILAFSTLKNL